MMPDREPTDNPAAPPLAAKPNRLKAVLPWLGASALLAFLGLTTDWPKAMAAVRQTDVVLFLLICGANTVIAFLYDCLCLTWLVRRTLGHRGQPGGDRFRDLAPLKAASYIINVLNYHAAALAMAFLIGRRKNVQFLEAAGALALLAYLDILTVTAMSVAGIWLQPEFFGTNLALQTALKTMAAAVFTVALGLVLLVQSPWQLPILQKLRQLPPARPLAALTPLRMAEGLILRAGLLGIYTVGSTFLMQPFGMKADFGRMMLAMPVITVVGTLPISVSGLGSTQVLMRTFYAPFVLGGRAPVPVIDAFSTLASLGGMGWRLLIAAPFFRKISKELADSPAGKSPP